MKTWQDIKAQIDDRKLDSSSWKSNKQSLLMIISYAEKHKINPEYFAEIPFSNKRTIIRYVRKAIIKEDQNRVLELFQWAHDLNNAYLRLKLGTPDLEDVFYIKSSDETKKIFCIFYSGDQFKRVQNLTKLHYRYVIKEE